MTHLLRSALAVMLVGLLAPAAWAHFNMLLPEKASARKGEAVTFLYQFGHPFEHQLFDAPAPTGVFVIAPGGKRTELTKALERIKVAGEKNKQVTAYRFRFTPEQRGDYTFILHTPPIWMEEDQEFIEDTVKVVLHVQAQKNWDAEPPATLRIVPLTRPYGLHPGMVFQAQVSAPGLFLAKDGSQVMRPVAGALVEVERYNSTPPAKLPPDEHITRTVKTDPNGVVTTTLTEPGWWSLTVQRDPHQREHRREHKGKEYPVRKRATLWVWVDAPPAGK